VESGSPVVEGSEYIVQVDTGGGYYFLISKSEYGAHATHKTEEAAREALETARASGRTTPASRIRVRKTTTEMLDW